MTEQRKPEERIANALESIKSSLNGLWLMATVFYVAWLIRGCHL